MAAVNKQGGPALMVLMAKSQEDKGGCERIGLCSPSIACAMGHIAKICYCLQTSPEAQGTFIAFQPLVVQAIIIGWTEPGHGTEPGNSDFKNYFLAY